MPTKSRQNIIESYLKQLLENYSQNIFNDQETTLPGFYSVITGMMFEQNGYLAQASLCYRASKHQFAKYSLGHFYEHGLGGNKKNAEKAKIFYDKAKEIVVEVSNINAEQVKNNSDNSDTEDTVASGLQFPTLERESDIEKTVKELIHSHSQKIYNKEFNQLLVGLMYEKLGYPVQAFLIYRNTKNLPQSLNGIGYFHIHGLGVAEIDNEKALKYFQKAKTLGASHVAPEQKTNDLSKINVKPNSPVAQPEQKVQIEGGSDANQQVKSTIASITLDQPQPTIEMPTKQLLFSTTKSVSEYADEEKLINLGAEFHSLRSKAGVAKSEVLPSYLGIVEILESRTKVLDKQTKASKDKIINNCVEIIKFYSKYPIAGFNGEISTENKAQLQYYIFQAHLYMSKHASESYIRDSHKAQATIEANSYLTLAVDNSSPRSLHIINYVAKNLFQDEMTKLVKNNDFSQKTLSIIALSLARIHRNSEDKLFFKVINAEYKFLPIQSIKLALELAQSALTMAKDTKSRTLAINDIEFMKRKFPNEIKTIQENSPYIVDTTRPAITISTIESTKRLHDLFETYFGTIEALFVPNKLHLALPKIMREMSFYFERENYMRGAVISLNQAAANIERVRTKEMPKSVELQASFEGKAIAFL